MNLAPNILRSKTKLTDSIYFTNYLLYLDSLGTKLIIYPKEPRERLTEKSIIDESIAE